MKKHNQGLKFAIVLLIGLLFSEMVTAMYLTESINFNCFFDVGNLYDIYSGNYRISRGQWFYDEGAKLIRIEGEEANCYLAVKSKQKNWKLLMGEIFFRCRKARYTRSILL